MTLQYDVNFPSGRVQLQLDMHAQVLSVVLVGFLMKKWNNQIAAL